MRCSTPEGVYLKGTGRDPGQRSQVPEEDAVKLAAIFRAILRGEEPVPQDWRLGRLVLISKVGGEKQFLRDYRPLTVTSTIYKTYYLHIQRTHDSIDRKNELLTELQCEFRRGGRIKDYLYTLTQCIEVARKEKRKLLCCFLDVAQAYENVPHVQLIQWLEELGFSHQWLALYGASTRAVQQRRSLTQSNPCRS